MVPILCPNSWKSNQKLIWCWDRVFSEDVGRRQGPHRKRCAGFQIVQPTHFAAAILPLFQAISAVNLVLCLGKRCWLGPPDKSTKPLRQKLKFVLEENRVVRTLLTVGDKESTVCWKSFFRRQAVDDADQIRPAVVARAGGEWSTRAPMVIPTRQRLGGPFSVRTWASTAAASAFRL